MTWPSPEMAPWLDTVGQCVADGLTARDTQPAPAPEYVVVRDCWQGCEYIAPSIDGERKFTYELDRADRYTKDVAAQVAKTMGNGWRVGRPT